MNNQSNAESQSPDHPDRSTKEREYLLSVSQEERRQAFEEEDQRWSRSEQIKDWLKLALLVAITLAWNLLVYFFSPGLR